MNPIKYFRIDLLQVAGKTPVYFYETENGEFDLRYGWAVYSMSVHTTLEDAIEDFLSHVQKEHNAKGDGIIVSASKPVEVSEAEVLGISVKQT